MCRAFRRCCREVQNERVAASSIEHVRQWHTRQKTHTVKTGPAPDHPLPSSTGPVGPGARRAGHHAGHAPRGPQAARDSNRIRLIQLVETTSKRGETERGIFAFWFSLWSLRQEPGPGEGRPRRSESHGPLAASETGESRLRGPGRNRIMLHGDKKSHRPSRAVTCQTTRRHHIALTFCPRGRPQRRIRNPSPYVCRRRLKRAARRPE